MSAFNRTRGTRLANSVRLSDAHWSRLRGLIGISASDFSVGQALWIRPCRGVHTLAMRFSLDVIYIDQAGSVGDALENLPPWRIAPVRLRAASVLELPAGVIRSSGTQRGDRIEILHSQNGDTA
jgi:uncharacterized membrane protein (UPF0127 family)